MIDSEEPRDDVEILEKRRVTGAFEHTREPQAVGGIFSRSRDEKSQRFCRRTGAVSHGVLRLSREFVNNTANTAPTNRPVNSSYH